MNSLIVVFSYHHKNTEKIAQAMAPSLGAKTSSPDKTDPNSLDSYDLVGFGSGIYYGNHHETLLDFVDKLPQVNGKKAFIFSTSGRTGDVAAKLHKKLRGKLVSKGFTVIGEFNCAGFDTTSFLKVFGGIKKNRPNADDLKEANRFAEILKTDKPLTLYVK